MRREGAAALGSTVGGLEHEVGEKHERKGGTLIDEEGESEGARWQHCEKMEAWIEKMP